MDNRTWMSYEQKFIDVCAPVASGDKFLLAMKAELSWRGSLSMGNMQRQSSLHESPKERA